MSSLFDFTLDRATKILFNITYSDMALTEVSQAAEVIKEVADPAAQIIFGLATDDTTAHQEGIDSPLVSLFFDQGQAHRTVITESVL